MERRISSLQRKVGYYEAQITQNPQQLQNRAGSDTNDSEHDDSDRVALSRQELAKLIQEEARKLAPEVKAQEAVITGVEKATMTSASLASSDCSMAGIPLISPLACSLRTCKLPGSLKPCWRSPSINPLIALSTPSSGPK
jgi:hypothetical protein